MQNAISGLTTFNMPSNPLYLDMMDTPNQIRNVRHTIAHHAAGHAVILALLGKRNLSIRMPSFSDTPHAELSLTLGVRFPGGPTVEDMLRKLCYLLGGYVAEHRFNQGEYRGIAAMSDYEEAVELADTIAKLTGICLDRLLLAVAYTVDLAQSQYLNIFEVLIRRLIREGFVSARDFSRCVRSVQEQDLAALVLKNYVAPDFAGWSEEYERMFA